MSRERACRVCRQKQCTCAGIGNCGICGRKFSNRAQFKRGTDRGMVCKAGAPCVAKSAAAA